MEELPLHALTEPYVTLSRHTAPHAPIPAFSILAEIFKQQEDSSHFCLILRLLQTCQPLCSTSITEASSLLRTDPPPPPALVLRLLCVIHLSFSLSIRMTGSHVPYESLYQVHAASMPNAIQAVNRLPLELFPRVHTHPGFDVTMMITTPYRRFTFVHLLDTYLTRYIEPFP